MKQEQYFFVDITVYNWESSRCYERHKYLCKSEGHGKSTARRLRALMGKKLTENRTGDWLIANLGIDGFIESVNGVFEYSVREVPE
jgi:hypothetical protein